MISEFRTIQIL